MAVGDYATLAELKAARRITNTDDDAALTSALVAAARSIDRKTGRRFWLDDVATTRIYHPAGRVVCDDAGARLLVDDIGSLDDLDVATGFGNTWTTVDPANFETGPDNAVLLGEPITFLARPIGVWSTSVQGRVRVIARWGWPAIPDEIRQATLLLANRLYMRKDAPEGIAASGEWGAIRMSRWDPDVEALTGPYTLPGIA